MSVQVQPGGSWTRSARAVTVTCDASMRTENSSGHPGAYAAGGSPMTPEQSGSPRTAPAGYVAVWMST